MSEGSAPGMSRGASPARKRPGRQAKTLDDFECGDVRHWRRGCRSPKCVEAQRIYNKRSRLGDLYGHQRLVDATEVKAHLRRLHSQGVSWDTVAELAGGIHRSSVHHMLKSDRVHEETVRAILAIPADLEGTNGGRVPIEPAQRRFRALRRAGWTFERIATFTGVPKSTVEGVTNFDREHTSAGVQMRVTRSFDGIAARSAPWAVGGARARLARSRSVRLDWVPLWVWEDADDPGSGLRFDPRSRVVEVVDGVRWIADCGGDRRDVADRFHLTWPEVTRLHREAGVEPPEVWRT